MVFLVVQSRGGKWWLPILQKEAQESEEDLHCMTKLTDHQCCYCQKQKKKKKRPN